MSAIYAIAVAAKRVGLNAAFEAMGYGPSTFDTAITNDNPATFTSPGTHYHMYHASALPSLFTTLADAKAGSLPMLDIEENAIAWGVGGVISEADAITAFSGLQIWANDSDRTPVEFAAEQRSALGLNLIPIDW